jgi:hypothetical protein
MPELSHSPFPAKRIRNRTWPKSAEAREQLPEPRGSKGKLMRNSKGRQGNSAGRGAQEEGPKSRAMLDRGFGPRGGAGNREQGRGKLRKKSLKRYKHAA